MLQGLDRSPTRPFDLLRLPPHLRRRIYLYLGEPGRLAVAPLALFAPLNQCHVRLSKLYDRPLQQIAEEAASQNHYSGSSPWLVPPQASSPLVDLPTELRVRILRYSDLVTPWKEVTWSREHRGYQICRPPCIISQGGCAPHIHHGCLISRCNYYAQDGLLYTRSHGRFCRRRHGAASSTCTCWAPPSSLFLVCRALCRDAQFVFFSENHFTIRNFHAELPFENLRHHNTSPIATDYPYGRLALSKFLRDVVPTHCLTILRFLELLLPIRHP
ncbi:hypothetical protein P885DRAFT_66286 [Corynascus similis CBS 632.67]